MLVVSDASPLNALIRIQHVGILPELFDHIIVPTAVVRELSHANTPAVIRSWLTNSPSWLEVRAPSAIDSSLPIGPGEREAISLARELRAELILIDDLKARRYARLAGLSVMGTLGVLERASARDLLDLKSALEALRQIDFKISDRLLAEALRRSRIKEE